MSARPPPSLHPEATAALAHISMQNAKAKQRNSHGPNFTVPHACGWSLERVIGRTGRLLFARLPLIKLVPTLASTAALLLTLKCSRNPLALPAVGARYAFRPRAAVTAANRLCRDLCREELKCGAEFVWLQPLEHPS